MKKRVRILYDGRFLTGLIIFICLYSVATGLVESIQRFRTLGVGHVHVSDKKGMAMLKMKLPKQGVVAYRTDRGYDLKTLGLLQYALSPLILLHDRDQERIIRRINGPSGYDQFCKQYPETEYIIGNFYSEAEYDRFCEKTDLELLGQAGDRIKLFRRSRKPEPIRN